MTDALKRWVAERRSIAEAATPGPWKQLGGTVAAKPSRTINVYGPAQRGESNGSLADDAAFIADARNCMSILLQIVEMQDRVIEKLISPSNLVHPVFPRCYCDACKTPQESAKDAREQVEALLKEKL